MKILLDTHIALWSLYDSKRLPKDIQDLIVDGDNDVYYSLVSAWEIEIKYGIGKCMVSGKEFIDGCDSSGFFVLPIKKKHIVGLDDIPLRKDHRDPFDRMLVSQSICEGMKLITMDSKLIDYV